VEVGIARRQKVAEVRPKKKMEATKWSAEMTIK
jgi:hypothetical protein